MGAPRAVLETEEEGGPLQPAAVPGRSIEARMHWHSSSIEVQWPSRLPSTTASSLMSAEATMRSGCVSCRAW